jgi:hypothetical protein
MYDRVAGLRQVARPPDDPHKVPAPAEGDQTISHRKEHHDQQEHRPG